MGSAIVDQSPRFSGSTDDFVEGGGGGGSISNMSFLRVMRLMKMLKLLRMIRMLRTFRELRLIINSILASMKSTFWAILLVCTISFMFAIAFLQGATNYLKAEGDSIDKKVLAEINEYWSSVGRSMLTLYFAATGGMDWAPLADSLWHMGWVFICCSCCIFPSSCLSLSMSSMVCSSRRR